RDVDPVLGKQLLDDPVGVARGEPVLLTYRVIHAPGARVGVRARGKTRAALLEPWMPLVGQIRLELVVARQIVVHVGIDRTQAGNPVCDRNTLGLSPWSGLDGHTGRLLQSATCSSLSRARYQKNTSVDDIASRQRPPRCSPQPRRCARCRW